MLGDGVDAFEPRHMLAVVYRDADNAIENSEWKSGDDTIEKGLTRIKDLLTRGKLIDIDEVQSLLQLMEKGNEQGEQGNIIDLGVRSVSIGEYTKSWSSESGRCVILGDAAHGIEFFMHLKNFCSTTKESSFTKIIFVFFQYSNGSFFGPRCQSSSSR